jgi:hypothetical protein
LIRIEFPFHFVRWRKRERGEGRGKEGRERERREEGEERREERERGRLLLFELKVSEIGGRVFIFRHLKNARLCVTEVKSKREKERMQKREARWREREGCLRETFAISVTQG